MELYEFQKPIFDLIRANTCLKLDTGFGKSILSLKFYDMYYKDKMKLIVVTTAKKRDSKEWIEDIRKFGITDFLISSWNNIQKLIDEKAFFIFDEHKASGLGVWGRCFIKIAKTNPFLLLSATPADRWIDYATLFIAVGEYRNITDFRAQHVIYAPYVNFPKIKSYKNVQKLEALRKKYVIQSYLKTEALANTSIKEQRIEFLLTDEETKQVKDIYQTRTSQGQQLQSAASIVYEIKKISSFREKVCLIFHFHRFHNKIIVFYNNNFELELLTNILTSSDISVVTNVYQYNGSKHETPDTDRYIYLVQYSAAEGWSSTADCVIFFSYNYSYRVMKQAKGRINRINTANSTLYYYYLTTNSILDKSIESAVARKKDFNENDFIFS